MTFKAPLRCAVCHKRRPYVCGGYCVCGSTAWELVPHEVPAGIAVETLDEDGSRLRPIHLPAILFQALGGIVPGRKVLVGGPPGAGKSTLCAQGVAQYADKFDRLGYWLDGEQNRDLVRDLFPRTGSSTKNIRLVSRIQGSNKVGWREALQAVPPDAVMIVVDSLQRWARSYAEQTTLLEAVSAMPFTALVVSHFNKAGQFAGPMGNEYDVDATAIIKPKSVEVTKCRWALCPRTVKRTELS